MSNEIILCDAQTSKEPITAAGVIDAIIKGLGRFGRSLGSLARDLAQSGYDINKVTRTPESTVWFLGNDKYRETKGEEGYLCQITIVPHPIQTPGEEPTYSVQVKTVEGLGDHSYVIENVTQAQVGDAVKSTMQAWDAQDNKTEEAIQTYATALANKSNKFVERVKAECNDVKADIENKQGFEHHVQELNALEKEAVSSTQDLHKYFLRSLRDAKSADEKVSECKKMDDALQDNIDEFNHALDELKDAIDKTEPESEEPESGESEVTEEMRDLGAEVAQCIHPTGKQIFAFVTKSLVDNELTYKLNRIVADVDPSTINKALETVLYDAAIAETIPEDTECILQLTEEPESYDVEMLSQQTTLDIRDVCVEILKTLYIALFNIDAIYFNSYGLDFPQLFESVDPARDIIKGLTFIVSRICAEQTHFWPQPLTYLTPDNLLDPSTRFTAESGLIALSDVINKVVECADLYRCNFSEFDQSQIITDINNLNVINSQIALKLQK